MSIFLTLIPSMFCIAQVTILVNKGPFSSVQEAAFSEEKVNFYDNDFFDDNACTECFAAMELARFLPEAINIKYENINVIDSEEIPTDGSVFIIGSSFSNSLIPELNNKRTKSLQKEQSYNIYSRFEDNRVITIIEGDDRKGTLYGVYRYLEELGIKFMGLGDKGTVLPHSPVEIPTNLNINESPSFYSRGFYTFGDRNVDEEFFLWMARNKLNYWTAENQPVPLLRKLGMKLIEGGHNVQGKIFFSDSDYPYNHKKFKGDEHKPDDSYKIGNEFLGDINNDGKLSTFEAHPEWYGMKDGERDTIGFQAKWGTNFCTSNEDARKEFAKRIVQSFIDGEWKNADIFNYWTFDGGAKQWCTCEKCKQDMSYTNRMFLVTYDILKEVANARKEGRLKRRVEIHNLAYSTTIDPPTKPLPPDYDYENTTVITFPYYRCYAHSFADPSCTEINQWQLEAYQGWTMGEGRYYKGSMSIGEYYHVSTIRSLPVVYTKIMATDIPWYYQSGARHFNYMHAPHKELGTWTLNHYLMGKLLWNAESNATAIVEEYFNLYYPTTTLTSKEFYKQLEIISANIKALKQTVRLKSGKNYSLRGRLSRGEDIFDIDHMKYEKHNKSLINHGPSILEMMEALNLAKTNIEQSLINCRDSTELKRLLEDKVRFDYGYAMYNYLYHIIRTSMFHSKEDNNMAKREFKTAKLFAEQLKEMVDVVQVSSTHANAVNGFEATGLTEIHKKFEDLYNK